MTGPGDPLGRDDVAPGPDPVRLGEYGPLVRLASVAVVILLALELREISSLIVPILFGLFLALIATPVVNGLMRRGASRALALTGAVGLVLAIVLVMSAIVAISVGQLVILLPTYEDRLLSVVGRLRELFASVGIASDPEAMSGLVSPGSLASLAQSAASAVSRAAAWLLVLSITFIFALSGGATLDLRARAALGQTHSSLELVERFGLDLRRYLVVRAQLGLFAAALTLVLLVVLGLPLPALWAFLIFAAAFIPTIGTIVAVIPPALLGLLDGGPAIAASVVVGVFLINLAQDYVLQPRMMATELNLSALVVFLSIITWTWILGPAGALLAVPLTVGLVALLEGSSSTRPLARLMRNEVDAPALTPKARGA